MAYSAFLEKDRPPSNEDLHVLGAAEGLWHQLVDLVCAEHDGTMCEWVFSGKNYGWSLRLKRKDRAVVYLAPAAGEFRAAFALGEKAVAAAQQGGLPESVSGLIADAPKYPEGRGVRIVVRTPIDVQTVLCLAKIKMSS